MPQPSGQLPRALAERTVFAELAGGVPALLVHPDEGWSERDERPTPRPTVMWMHGRTASKELDPGRYLRWMRAGIATCAIDLPHHGARASPERQDPRYSLDTIEEALAEIGPVLESLIEERFNHAFDPAALAIGGMSLGGMVALARLCREHPFTCAAVESTSGDFALIGEGDPDREEKIARLSPLNCLDGWRPIPLLALHSEADRITPVERMRTFMDALHEQTADGHTDRDAHREQVRFVTWDSTGAPYEHSGFGRYANEAKNLQTEFLAECLHPAGARPPAPNL